MSAAVFIADPLLARAAPAPGDGGFDVQSLLVPVQAAFAPDPLLAPPTAAEELQEAEASTDGADTLVLHHSEDPGQTDPGSVAASTWPPELQALLEQRYREGFDEGLAQGAGLGSADGMPSNADRHSHADAHGAQGDGPAAPSDHAPSDHPRDVAFLLESLSRALQPLLLPDDAAARFEPLKRLALHLAMELVRQELSVSPKVIDELVRRSVQALQAGEQAPLTVELHPQDWALLQQAWDDPASGLPPDTAMRQRVHWVEDPELARGSVRARSDASTVEDLIQHRLASIMQDLQIQSQQWQQDEAQIQQSVQGPSDHA
jgi:flagellar biosynthesis/type III secretory pathway protein FliH